MDSRAKVFLGKDSLLAFDVEDKRISEAHVRESVGQLSYIPAQVNSFSTGNVSYTIQVPSADTVIDRNIIENLAFTATIVVQPGKYDATDGSFEAQPFTGATAKSLVSQFEICLRANPISAITSSAVLNVDGTQFNLPNCNNIASVLNRFNNKSHQKATLQSIQSPMYDGLSYSSDLVNAACSPWVDIGSLDLSEDTILPRQQGITSTTYTLSVDKKTCTITCQINVSEAVCMPLLTNDVDNEKGLFGVRNIQLNRQFVNLTRLIHVAFTGPTEADGENQPVSFQIISANVQPAAASPNGSSAALLVKYVTAKDVRDLPTVQRISTPNIQVFPSSGQPAAIPDPCTDSAVKMLRGSTPYTLSFDSLSLGYVPSFLVFWVSYSDSEMLLNQAITTPDRLFPIKSVSIQIGNSQNILNSATIYDMYKLSLDSYGYCSFDQFIANRFGQGVVSVDTGVTTITEGLRPSVNGFPMCIDVSKLTLDASLAVGLRAPVQLTVSISYQNTGNDVVASTVNPACYGAITSPRYSSTCGMWEYIPATVRGYMMVITPGVTTIDAGKLTSQVGLFTSSELVSAEKEMVHVRTERKGSVVGGSFWDTVKSIGDIAVPLLSALGEVGGERMGRGLDARGLDARGQIGGRKLFY